MILEFLRSQKQTFVLAKKVIADTGYQGLQKIHNRTEFPKKRRKKIKINQRRQNEKPKTS